MTRWTEEEQLLRDHALLGTEMQRLIRQQAARRVMLNPRPDPPSRRQVRPLRTPLAVAITVAVEFLALVGAILAVWLLVLVGWAPFLAP